MQVSIIIPVFNEAPLIRPFLSNLRERTRGAEIIVVDGASTDGTDRLAQGFCDQVIRSGERSRAKQMNVGADAAGGDILWFLHADAEVPLESLNEIAADNAQSKSLWRFLSDPPAGRAGRIPTDGRLCALRRAPAPDAMRRSWNVLPANSVC